MTHEETVKLIGLLIVAYPSYDKFKDQSHIRSTVALWDKIFADDDFGLVQTALEKHIATSKWPPSIAELREIMAEMTNPGLLDKEEAWELVQKLLETHSSLWDSTEKYLPRIVAQAVDGVGYDQLYALHCAVSRRDYDKAGLAKLTFMQAYEERLIRAKEKAVMPKRLYEQYEQVKKLCANEEDRAAVARLDREYTKQQEYLHAPSNGLLEALESLRNLPEIGTPMLPESTRENGDSE